jgi:hypothetical protein
MQTRLSAGLNFPENHLWRSRTTSQRVNELAPNMGFLNLTKE